MQRLETLALFAVLSTVAVSCSGAPLTPGNLIVVQVGDGSSALSGVGTPTRLIEMNSSGSTIQTITLPESGTLAQRSFTLSGLGNSEGTISRSGNGRFLTLAGYDANPGEAVVNTAAIDVNRVIARIDPCGRVDTSTSITDSPSGSAAPIRAAVTNDGSSYWFVGGGSSTGVRWTAHATQGSSTRVSDNPGNARVVRIFGGQLYVSAAAPTYNGVGPVGSGLPTTPGTISDQLLGVGGAGASVYDFSLADATTIFVADDGAISGGLKKQTYNSISGNWDLNYSTLGGVPSGSQLRRLCARDEGGTFVVYAISDDSQALLKLVDSGPAPSFVTIATAPANTAFRGIDFAPSFSCCPADLDNDGDASNGVVPDGGVDIGDLLLFLAAFEGGSSLADLDNDGLDPGSPDGGVDVNDLLFFLSHFEGGC